MSKSSRKFLHSKCPIIVCSLTPVDENTVKDKLFLPYYPKMTYLCRPWPLHGYCFDKLVAITWRRQWFRSSCVATTIYWRMANDEFSATYFFWKCCLRTYYKGNIIHILTNVGVTEHSSITQHFGDWCTHTRGPEFMNYGPRVWEHQSPKCCVIELCSLTPTLVNIWMIFPL
jgi:NADH:ubiquinone oxidoreductase subunit